MTQSESTPQYKIGDEVTVSRGKAHGQSGKVSDVGTTAYAVKFADGSISLINFGNVKDRVEPTITATQLGDVLGTDGADLSDATLNRLEAAVPGITDHIIRAYSSAS